MLLSSMKGLPEAHIRSLASAEVQNPQATPSIGHVALHTPRYGHMAQTDPPYLQKRNILGSKYIVVEPIVRSSRGSPLSLQPISGNLGPHSSGFLPLAFDLGFFFGAAEPPPSPPAPPPLPFASSWFSALRLFCFALASSVTSSW